MTPESSQHPSSSKPPAGSSPTLALVGATTDRAEPPSAELRSEPARSPIEAWLDGFTAMLGGREADAHAIRDELSDHLNGRTRDLMLGGTTEAQAARQAIDELGEAGEVAARYRKLQPSPRRRSIMYGTLFGVSTAAVVLSVASIVGRSRGDDALLQLQLVQSREREAAIQASLDAALKAQQQATAALPAPAAVPERRPAASSPMAKQPTAVATTFTPHHPSEHQAAEIALPPMEFTAAKLGDVLDRVAAAAKLTLDVDWRDLESGGPQAADPVTLQTAPMPLGAFLSKLTRTLPAGDPSRTLDYRVDGGVLRVSSRSGLDRAEVQLVSYDVSRVVESWSSRFNQPAEDAMQRMREAIQEFVEPDAWADNGGDLAKLSIIGDRLFIQAPARFHPKIQWVLDQAGSGQPAPGPAALTPLPPAPPGAAAPTANASAAPGVRLRLENGKVVLDSGNNRLVRADRMQLEFNSGGCIGTATGGVELVTNGHAEPKGDAFPLHVK